MIFHAFLIKYAEIAIKGKNRYIFEDALVKQMNIALSKVEGEFAFAEFHEEVLGSAFSFLIQGKFHVDEIFSDGAGEGFSEDVEVFEGFLL